MQSSSTSVEFPAKEFQRGGQADTRRQNKRIETSAQLPSEPQTPTTSAVLSEADSTRPTTPSSANHTITSRSQSRSRAQTKSSKHAVPVVPVVPIVPQGASAHRQAKDDTSRAFERPKTNEAATNATAAARKEPVSWNISEEPPKPVSPARAAPKSWADLVRHKAHPRGAGAAGVVPAGSTELTVPKNESLADVLSRLGEDVTQYSDKVAFLEPRGLVNTGNMCYMNSVCRLSCPLRTLLIAYPNRYFKFLFHAYPSINS